MVHKTEIIRDTLNPCLSFYCYCLNSFADWKEFSLPVGKLTLSNNENTVLFIECFDWDKDGKHDLIGDFKTTYAEIKSGKRQFELIHPEKKRKKGAKYSNSGSCSFLFSNSC